MSTQPTVPNTNPPADSNADMQFDSAPVAQALTVPSQVNGPANVPSGDDGMTFDAQPTKTPISVPVSAPTAPQHPTGLQRAISTIKGQDDPSGSWYPELGDAFAGGVKSAANGAAGLIDWINNPHGQSLNPNPVIIKDAISDYRKQHPEVSQQQAVAYVQAQVDKGKEPVSTHLKDAADFLRSGGQPTGFWENVGSIGEQALEWIGMDGITKLASAPMKVAEAGKAGSAAVDTVGHIAQAGKVAQVLQDNPKLAGLVSIGLKASRDALMAGSQNYLHTEDPHSAVETGLLGGGLSATVRAGSALVGRGIQAIRTATDSSGAASALAGSVRSVLDNVAQDAGVPKPTAPSIRDAVGQVGNAVKAQASKLYAALDASIGGTRWQAASEQVSAARDELRNSLNLDHDAHGELLEKYNAIEDAKLALEQQARDAGVDPESILLANSKYAQGQSLLDFAKHVQSVSSGLRPELQSGLKAGQTAAPETLSATGLAQRANRMYNSGRLTQGLGQAHAQDLLRVVEAGAQRERQIAANRSVAGTALKAAGKAIGIGAGGAAGVGLVKHLLD
jgi:hypothetical protein